MKLHEYSLLNESLSSARKRYLDTGKINSEAFLRLSGGDPTPTKKYLEQMCKMWVSPPHPSTNTINGRIHLFDKAVKTKYELPSKDIQYYKNIDMLNEALEGFEAFMLTRKTNVKREGVELIYDNDKCVIYYIKTYEASKIYGAHTRWCVTQYDNDMYWFEYNTINLFCFLLSKENDEKYALVINMNKLSRVKQRYPLDAIQTFNPQDTDMSDLNQNIMDSFDIDFEAFKASLLSKIDVNKIRKEKREQLKEFFKNSIYVHRDNSLTALPSEYYLPYAFIDIGKGRLTVKFKSSEGTFNINGKDLTTLKGTPQIVKGDFSCANNSLTTLTGGPKEVSGSYICSGNPLKSLKGAPKTIHGNLKIRETGITSLKGLENTEILGELILNHSNNLRSLAGLGPQNKLKRIQATYCSKLTSLKGFGAVKNNQISADFNYTSLKSIGEAPKKLISLQLRYTLLRDLKGLENTERIVRLNLSYCSKLKSVEGCPKSLGILYLYDCPRLESLEGLAGVTIDEYLDIRYCNGIKSLEPLYDLQMTGMSSRVVLSRQNFTTEQIDAYLKAVDGRYEILVLD